MYKLCCKAISHNVPFAIENPRRSLLWQMPLMKELAARTDVNSSRHDYCQFGTKWMKPTKLMARGNPLLHLDQVVCQAARNEADPGGPTVCSRTNAPHTMLDGTARVKPQPIKRSKQKTQTGIKPEKKFMTHVAEPYPEKVCSHWSMLMVINDRLRNNKMSLDEAEESPVNIPRSYFPELGQAEASALIVDHIPKNRVTPARPCDIPPDDRYPTHVPKHTGCDTCFKAKTQKKAHENEGKRDDPEHMPLPRPWNFGDTITADHLSFNKRDRSQRGDRFALGVQDRYTGWIDGFPALDKSAEGVKAAMLEFLSSADEVIFFD